MKATHARCLVLLPALALAGCSSSIKPTTAGPVSAGAPTVTSSASHPPTVGSPSATAATTSPSATGTTTLPSATTTAAATTGAPVTTASARPGRCVSARLGARLGQSEGAAGHSFVALLLRNRGSVICRLKGYPGVSFTAGTDSHQVGAPAQRDRRFGAATVTLVPGATVHATVDVANYSNYDPHSCRPARATGFRVYPPGSTGSLLIHAPQTVCSSPGLQGFRVSVVRAGTSPD